MSHRITQSNFGNITRCGPFPTICPSLHLAFKKSFWLTEGNQTGPGNINGVQAVLGNRQTPCWPAPLAPHNLASSPVVAAFIPQM
jgi:hypothetical protein